MDELFAESVFTACCCGTSSRPYLICTYLRTAKADSKPQLPARACSVDAGGSIIV